MKVSELISNLESLYHPRRNEESREESSADSQYLRNKVSKEEVGGKAFTEEDILNYLKGNINNKLPDMKNTLDVNTHEIEKNKDSETSFFEQIKDKDEVDEKLKAYIQEIKKFESKLRKETVHEDNYFQELKSKQENDNGPAIPWKRNIPSKLKNVQHNQNGKNLELSNQDLAYELFRQVLEYISKEKADSSSNHIETEASKGTNLW